MVENIVGQRFESISYGWFIVIRKTSEMQGRHYLYEVEFDEWNGVKYKTLKQKSNIKYGKIKNPYFPSVCGVGYLGNASYRKNEFLYNKWQSMLGRCYNPKFPNYKYYGAKGVAVDEKWHSFENFLHDFPLIDGYDENNFHNLELDKDIKLPDNKIYSFETCSLVTKTENIAEEHKRKNKWFKAISPEGQTYENNNQSEFAREHNLKRNGLKAVLSNRQKTHKGWKFEYLE